MEIYTILDCFATARNDSLSSRVSETNAAIQNKIVLYLKPIWIASLRSQWRSKELGLLHFVRNDGQRNLDCEATALRTLLHFVRNDGQRSLMTPPTLYTSTHNKATDWAQTTFKVQHHYHRHRNIQMAFYQYTWSLIPYL